MLRRLRLFLRGVHPIENRLPESSVKQFLPFWSRAMGTNRQDVLHSRAEVWDWLPVEEQRSVKVAIIGNPNVGKSTLVNTLMAQPVAGVSAVRRTTQGRLTGVITLEDTQIVFLDTPGLLPGEFKYHSSPWKREEYLASETAIKESVGEADLVVFVVDSRLSLYRHFVPATFKSLLESDVTKILVFNKIDVKQDSPKYELMRKQYTEAMTTRLPDNVTTLVPRNDIPAPHLSFREDFISGIEFKEVIALSGLRGRNLEFLWKEIREGSVVRPWEFSPETVSPDSVETIVTDIVRTELLTKGVKGWQFEQKFVGYLENEDGSCTIEHLLFLRAKPFSSKEDREDSEKHLTQQLSQRFGRPINFLLKFSHYSNKHVLIPEIDDTFEPIVDVIED